MVSGFLTRSRDAQLVVTGATPHSLGFVSLGRPMKWGDRARVEVKVVIETGRLREDLGSEYSELHKFTHFTPFLRVYTWVVRMDIGQAL